jgi:hypothetical protein
MTGGEVTGSSGIHDTVMFDISSGTLHGVTTYQNGNFDFSGGTMFSLQAYDSSVVNLCGGEIITGYVYATHNVEINVFGYGFDYWSGGVYDGGTLPGF